MKHILSERSVYLGQIEFELLIISENKIFYLWSYLSNTIKNYNIERKWTLKSHETLSEIIQSSKRIFNPYSNSWEFND